LGPENMITMYNTGHPDDGVRQDLVLGLEFLSSEWSER